MSRQARKQLFHLAPRARCFYCWLMPSEPLICKGLISSGQVIRDAGTGKISLINCFTAFYAPAFPFQAPPFFITALISGLVEKGKPIQFKVSIKRRESDVYLLDVSGQLSQAGQLSFRFSVTVGPLADGRPLLKSFARSSIVPP